MAANSAKAPLTPSPSARACTSASARRVLRDDLETRGRVASFVGGYASGSGPFNSHRIHYDRPYAATVEGYPTLVVHRSAPSSGWAGSAHRATGRRLGTIRFPALAVLLADVPFITLGGTD